MSTKTLSKAEISKSNLSDENEMPKASSSKFSKIASINPRIKELMNDKIFQYYFVVYYNSKEYSEFKNLPDQEKLSFMISLYFFIMKDVTKNNLFDLKTVTTEEQMNNINGEILDRLLMLKDGSAKKRIINTMNIFNINNITEQGSHKAKFQSILDKYKLNDALLDKLNSNNNWNQYRSSNLANNTINVNIASNTLKYRDRDLEDKIINNMNNSSFYKNSIIQPIQNYSQKTTPLPIHSMPLLLNNNKDNSNNNIIGFMPSSFSLKKLSQTKKNSFVKIDYNEVSLENLGQINQGNFYINTDQNKEIDFTSEKSVYFSNPNGIQKDNSSHYIICNTKKFKHPNNKSEFTTQLNYKTLVNPHQVSTIKYNYSNTKASNGKFKGNSQKSINFRSNRRNCGYQGRNPNEKVIHDIVLLNQSINDTKLNVILTRKNSMPEDMNEIINKLFFDYDNNNNEMNTIITLNTNEANKIGILLIDFIRLEKKYNEILNSKTQLQKKYENNIFGFNKYRSNIETKLNDSKLFLQANVV